MNFQEAPPAILPGYSHHYADLDEVRMHYVRATEPRTAPTVVLLHGWPETWWTWRKVVPLLDDYDLIMPDLRGLGDTSKSASRYDKSSIAGDVAELLNEVHVVGRLFIVGHDWGGVVAFALASQLRERVDGLAILDVTVPLPPTPNGPDFSQGGRRWHHAFHQTAELPEAVIIGHEPEYYGWFFRNLGHRPDVLSTPDINEYLRTYSDPAATVAGLAYYRSLNDDRAMGQAALHEPKFTFPVLALGGRESWGRGDEPAESLQIFAHNVSGRAIPQCGHWIPEEQPEVLSQELRTFFEAAR